MGRRKDSLNSGTALMSPQQTALAACCRRSVWWADPIASPLSQTCEAAPAAPGDVEDSVPLSPPAKQLLMSCVMLKTQTLSLPPAKQLLMSCCDVEDSDPVSSTSEAAPYELCDVEDSDPSLHW